MLACIAMWVSSSGVARAYEDEATLGLAVGYAGISEEDGLPNNGLHLAVSASLGFGDAWSLQGLLGYDFFPNADPLHIGVAGLEAVYALDIVRFVPLFGFGLDGLLSVRDRQTRGDFALHALLGFDFLVDRRWTVGADARGLWIATHANSRLGPFVIHVALRAGVRFGLR
jgi:hypothetical protein